MRRLGTSKICVTPQNPVRMCGFGFRTTPYDQIKSHIFVRVFDLREALERAVIIYCDLIWWNPEFVELMKKVLGKQLDIDQKQVFFVASHNHSGPGTGSSFIPMLETADQDYVDFLVQQILSGVSQAQGNLEEVVLKRGEGCCGLNVYRRVMTEEGIQMMPNYQVKPDQTLTTLSFYRKDGSLKGSIIHYPCHANLSKGNDLHPDYPGIALDLIDGNNPNSISMFWQGCTADMRPNCVLGDQFKAGTYEDVLVFAASFYACARQAMAKEREMPEPGMEIIHKRIPLEVRQVLNKEEVEAYRLGQQETLRQWADKVLEKDMPEYEILEISALKLGTQMCYFFNAEVSMHYAAAARDIHEGAICTGYANGMIGYLSSRKQIEEGGYEPYDSAFYFAVAGTYAASIQETIETAMEGLEEEGEVWKKDA